MALRDMDDWYDLTRETNWTPSYLSGEELFPPELSDPFGIAIEAWESFDEPYMICYRDSERSRRWSAALVAFALGNEANRAVLKGWVEKWMPLGRKAISAYCDELSGTDSASQEAIAAIEEYHRGLGLAG